ncbi:MAG: hypothetical protein ACP5N1_01335, partial [Candidatus Woesearchaeota archaeon]
TLDGVIYSSIFSYPVLNIYNDENINGKILQIYAGTGIITSLDAFNDNIITGHMTGDIYMIPKSRIGEMSSADRLKKEFLIVDRSSMIRGLGVYYTELLDCGDYNRIYSTDLTTRGSKILREFPVDYTCLALGIMPTSETIVELTPSNIIKYGENL